MLFVSHRAVLFLFAILCFYHSVFAKKSDSKSAKKSGSNSGSGSQEHWETGELTYIDVDLTLEIGSAGADVVDAALDTIDLTCIFDDDKLLLRRMAAALTNDGLDEETYLGGAEGGIWNISESLFTRTQILPQLAFYRTAVLNWLGIDWPSVEYNNLTKPLLSALAAKLYLQSISAEIPRTVVGQAELVAKEILPGSPGLEEDFVQNLDGREDESCRSATLDVVLVLDGSGSVTSDSFDKVRNFVRQFLDAVDLGSDYTRVGVVQYSSEVQVEFYLNEFYDKEAAKDKVTNIRYLKGSTNTAAALHMTADTMFNPLKGARGDNSGVPKVSRTVLDDIVLPTDNAIVKSKVPKAIISTRKETPTRPGETAHAAQQLRDAGVSVFAVGIGKDVDVSELNSIASDPDCSHVFELAGFDEVIDFVAQIKRLACKEPAQLTLGSDIIATLQAGQKLFSTFVADVNKGIKIDIATHVGEVKLYLSTKTKNPNSASHQWNCKGNMHKRGRCFIPPGQLKKLVREGRSQISVYAGYEADDVELARFYTIISDEGNRVASSVALASALLCVKFLFN